MGLTKPRAAQIFNLDYKQSTRVATVANVTLTGGAPTPVDGVNVSVGDRVLVTGQSTASQNGLYQVATVGSGANGTWVRTSDANETGEIEAGMIVMVTEGTEYGDTQWKLTTNDPIVLGTTALTFVFNVQTSTISSGTSNVVVNANANVTISSAGTANVLTVSNTGASVSGIISVSGNITGGNIATAGIISATGNITGNFILGNGSQLTGIDATSIQNGTSNVRVVSSGGNVTMGIGGVGNVAVVASTGVFVTGVNSVSGNVQGGNLRTAGLISATGAVTGAAITGTSLTVTTGNITAGNLLLSGAIVDSAQLDIQTSAANANIALAPNGTGIVTVSTQVSAVGNVTGGNIRTAGLISATSTITSAANVIGGNISTAGVISATANITGGNILTGGLISATSTITSAANVTGGNISTAGLITATGNIQGGNIRTAGLISATGSLNTGGNLNFTNAEASDSAKIYANVSTSTTSLVLEVSDDDASDRIVLRHSYFVTSTTVDMLSAQRSGNTEANVTITGNLIATNQVTATGNVTGGNLRTAGQVSATANVTGGNILTGGLISATSTITSAANITGGNILTGGVVSATANITGGNLRTAGQVSATANITGGNILTGGLITATGNATAGNILTAGLISATGNVTGGNILGNGAGLTGIVAFGNITVTGGNSAVANSISSTLILAAGDGITITANAVSDTITIATSGSGDSIFATGGDMGLVTEPVTASEDLGLVTQVPVTAEFDLGTVATGGPVYPSQLVLPSFTVAGLPSASPAGQLVLVSNESGGAVPAFSDGTNFRRVTDRAIVT